ncbi:hypothetical protein EZV62_005785 [Acer yangbiense]|uniref:Protein DETOXIFICATION n=1 Tax=Acer yangbiense TaxID=1000413 RepID=A0A5C7INN4_9ROSI|nr:hypothetical protein EZV62_005785 [Acer yangbiense]
MNDSADPNMKTPFLNPKSPNTTTTQKQSACHDHLSLAIREAISIAKIAFPMILTGLLLYSRSMISMIFLGRLGELALAGGSLAVVLANITGYSVLSGLAMGMEPICGQAFELQLLQWAFLIQTTSLIYIFPSSLSFSVSTRVGNELGANQPKKAKLAAVIGLCCSSILGFSALAFAITVRKVWASMFTQDKEILALTSMVLPIIGLCELGNCPQTTGCGVLRGTARHTVGANINLGCFCLVGFPVAVWLSFYAGFDFEGLWFGLLVAQGSCVVTMLVVLAQTDWDFQAQRAKELTGDHVVVDDSEEVEEQKPPKPEIKEDFLCLLDNFDQTEKNIDVRYGFCRSIDQKRKNKAAGKRSAASSCKRTMAERNLHSSSVSKPAQEDCPPVNNGQKKQMITQPWNEGELAEACSILLKGLPELLATKLDDNTANSSNDKPNQATGEAEVILQKNQPVNDFPISPFDQRINEEACPILVEKFMKDYAANPSNDCHSILNEKPNQMIQELLNADLDDNHGNPSEDHDNPILDGKLNQQQDDNDYLTSELSDLLLAENVGLQNEACLYKDSLPYKE